MPPCYLAFYYPTTTMETFKIEARVVIELIREKREKKPSTVVQQGRQRW